MTALKILIVVTSHGLLGDTGKPTGYYLPEVTHPAKVFLSAGLGVDIASPDGGLAPIDPNSVDFSDPINQELWNDSKFKYKLENTIAATSVDSTQYAAILFAGGHGTMWDFPNNTNLQRLAANIYERGGVVAAVCHGPAALVNIRLENGEYLVKGKRITSFTNSEEIAVELDSVMPFPLETELKNSGGVFIGQKDWEENVIVDERLITGQNPASAHAVGLAVVEAIKH